ncbi:MAG: transcription elongation factor GreA [Chloroflexi bacterium]|nr:transcription elongation factor GreA [Chloroflexota bacterium]
MQPEKPVVLTPEGRRKLVEELDHLRQVRRPEILDRLRAAREVADTWDSPEYVEAKNDQAFVEGRIRALEATLAAAKVLEAHKGSQVELGSRVAIRDEEGEESLYTIVGPQEASPAHGKISDESPVGRALLGHRAGDEVQVTTPAGPRRLAILRVE